MKLEVSTEELQKQRLFIGTPMYGGQCTGIYTKSTNDLSMLCSTHKIPMKYYFLFNESLIQRARNYIVDEFMRSDCTHLLFIDADIGFDPRDALALLALQISDPEKYDIVCGPYPKKTIAWEKVSIAAQQGIGKDNPFELEQYTSDFVFNPVAGIKQFKLSEPVQVAEGGTGFMLITRAALEKYRDSYPELAYRPDHVRTEQFDGSRDIHAYFDCIIDPKSRRYLSEDYFFCHKAREIDLKVWMCPWMKINHVGSYIFKGNMGTLGQLGVTATADEKSNKKAYNPIDKSK
tara:strand:- start:1729 stop:2598 length:870 start_codon:yes stop_codon:yes gene_type:complete